MFSPVGVFSYLYVRCFCKVLFYQAERLAFVLLLDIFFYIKCGDIDQPCEV